MAARIRRSVYSLPANSSTLTWYRRAIGALKALPRSQRGDWVETAPELAARARGLIDAGDIVLVKGSKGVKVSLVVDALRKMGQGTQPKEGIV